MTESHEFLLKHLDAFVDTTLDDETRARFEAALPDHDDIRAIVNNLRTIDDAIAQTYKPSDTIDFANVITRAANTKRHRRSIPLFAAAAAIVLLLLSAGVFFAMRPGAFPVREHPTLPFQLHHPADLFASLQSQQFPVEWECDNDEEFAEATSKRLGTPVLIHQDDPAIIITGWNYRANTQTPAISPSSMVLMATVENKPVIVILDRLTKDPGDITSLPPRRDLTIHRRALEGVVLYEITPHQTPALLDRFYIPEPTPAEDPADASSAP